METVRKGIRNDELYKDTYQRLTCEQCDRELATESDPSEPGTIRQCPDCKRQWRQLR